MPVQVNPLYDLAIAALEQAFKAGYKYPGRPFYDYEVEAAWQTFAKDHKIQVQKKERANHES